jgi:ubiquilin
VQPEMNNAMMNALTNNPELFRAMMQSNPIMQRLMETNPQLAQALNNPDVLRDAARAMSSPVRYLVYGSSKPSQAAS